VDLWLWSAAFKLDPKVMGASTVAGPEWTLSAASTVDQGDECSFNSGWTRWKLWCSFNGSWTKVILVLFVAGQRCSGADSTVPGQKEKTELTQLSGLFCKIRVWAPFNIFKYERLFIFWLNL
jgi:hypothetical protein